MVGTKNNRRSQMTERLIQDSLIDLLKSQTINEITVTAVCKAADINRGTFYAHYNDVKDCMHTMEQDATKELLAVINEHTHPHSLRAILTGIFEVVKKRHAVTSFILTTDQDFLMQFIAITKREIDENNRIKGPAVSARERQYMFEYYVNGIVGVVRYWLKTGLHESPEQLANFINDWWYRGKPVQDMTDLPPEN
ncbi:TetR/AcrR family transcriptional regulator [Lactiplantibacillus fabifermentans]|uniref:Transcription regulator n=1 Tax=Lactiplantibacillus fabifermentans DSM 21115 TaxID=1413187 RepID=A0A0R2NMP9_9LACO|nr:TetR/AcrR family transcriptional regulator [Lactiplantibacillus fabifermentans]KRO26981.1 transcription regulator [Lactiplantibacillus fabifermentans DSM 21115]